MDELYALRLSSPLSAVRQSMVDSLRNPEPHNSASPDRLSEDTDLQTLLSAILGESLPDNAGASSRVASENVVSLALHRTPESAVTSPTVDAPQADDRDVSAGEMVPSGPRTPVPFVARKKKRDARPTTQNGVWRPFGDSINSSALRDGDAPTSRAQSSSMSLVPQRSSDAPDTKAGAAGHASGSIRAGGLLSESSSVNDDAPPFWRRPLVVGVTLAAIVLVIWAGSRSSAPRANSGGPSTNDSRPAGQPTSPVSQTVSPAGNTADPSAAANATAGAVPTASASVPAGSAAANATGSRNASAAESTGSNSQVAGTVRNAPRASRTAPARRAPRRQAAPRRRSNAPAADRDSATSPAAPAASETTPAAASPVQTTP